MYIIIIICCFRPFVKWKPGLIFCCWMCSLSPFSLTPPPLLSFSFSLLSGGWTYIIRILHYSTIFDAMMGDVHCSVYFNHLSLYSREHKIHRMHTERWNTPHAHRLLEYITYTQIAGIHHVHTECWNTSRAHRLLEYIACTHSAEYITCTHSAGMHHMHTECWNTSHAHRVLEYTTCIQSAG